MFIVMHQFRIFPQLGRFSSGFMSGSRLLTTAVCHIFSAAIFRIHQIIRCIQTPIAQLARRMLVVILTRRWHCFHFGRHIWIWKRESDTFTSIALTTKARCVSLATESSQRATEFLHFWQIMLGSIQMISQRPNSDEAMKYGSHCCIFESGSSAGGFLIVRAKNENLCQNIYSLLSWHV